MLCSKLAERRATLDVWLSSRAGLLYLNGDKRFRTKKPDGRGRDLATGRQQKHRVGHKDVAVKKGGYPEYVFFVIGPGTGTL